MSDQKGRKKQGGKIRTEAPANLGMAFRPEDLAFMRVALEEARSAALAGDVPVGAVVVHNGKILGRAGNRREQDGVATAHAEILAIEEACRTIGSWRLSDCTLYVTLEPCPMCAGATVNARIGRVVYGVKDAKAGACGSVLRLYTYPLNHAPEVVGGILERECAQVLSEFFRERRRKQQSVGTGKLPLKMRLPAETGE